MLSYPRDGRRIIRIRFWNSSKGHLDEQFCEPSLSETGLSLKYAANLSKNFSFVVQNMLGDYSQADLELSALSVLDSFVIVRCGVPYLFPQVSKSIWEFLTQHGVACLRTWEND